LQPGDVRRDIEILRLQRYLIVGILHIGDDLVDDANFFSECVHFNLLVNVVGISGARIRRDWVLEKTDFVQILHNLASHFFRRTTFFWRV
jgi:hypothetical protein